MLMAITLDGKIAKTSDHFPDWTGKADKKYFMNRTKEAGCLIMGNTTYKTIGRPLPGRKNMILTRDKSQIQNPNFKKSELEFTDKAPAELLGQLGEEGFEEVMLCGGAQINTLFAKAGLIDEIILTISPLAFGEGMSLFNEVVDLNLELLELTTLDENLVLVRYKVLK